jgi:hypothetical protein
MGFPPELNDQVFTFKSTDLTSALPEAERPWGNSPTCRRPTTRERLPALHWAADVLERPWIACFQHPLPEPDHVTLTSEPAEPLVKPAR